MEKIVWKSLCCFKRTCSRCNYFWKEENVTLNRKITKTAPRYNAIYICREKLIQKVAGDKNQRKVRDYSHFTGTCRGSRHSICNLRFNVPNKISVVFHDGTN